MYLFLVQKPLPLEPSIILYHSSLWGGGGVWGPRLMKDFGESLDFQGEQRGEGAQSSLTKFMGGGGEERKSVREVIRSLEY